MSGSTDWIRRPRRPTRAALRRRTWILGAAAAGAAAALLAGSLAEQGNGLLPTWAGEASRIGWIGGLALLAASLVAPRARAPAALAGAAACLAAAALAALLDAGAPAWVQVAVPCPDPDWLAPAAEALGRLLGAVADPSACEPADGAGAAMAALAAGGCAMAAAAARDGQRG